jgi:hypothetical protein
MACFLPVRLYVSVGLRVFEISRPTPPFSRRCRRPLGFFTSTRASLTFKHCLMSPCPGSIQAMSPSVSLELSAPSALSRCACPSFHFLSKASEENCRFPQKFHSQGLATLSMVSSSHIPGSLFQPPTLLGFTLQSFAPIMHRKNSHRISSFVLTLCSETISASNRRSNDLLRKTSCSPHCTLKD